AAREGAHRRAARGAAGRAQAPRPRSADAQRRRGDHRDRDGARRHGAAHGAPLRARRRKRRGGGMKDPSLVRWRLILGDAAAGPSGATAGGGGLEGDDLACDAALSWLYDREPGLADRDIQDRRGNLGPSQLDVPTWLDEVHRLFPKETIERLEM